MVSFITSSIQYFQSNYLNISLFSLFLLVGFIVITLNFPKFLPNTNTNDKSIEDSVNNNNENAAFVNIDAYGKTLTL